MDAVHGLHDVSDMVRCFENFLSISGCHKGQIMVTLAKLCLVMTVVLGLAFAEPRPVWSRTEREQDTGDEVGLEKHKCLLH